MTNDNDLEKIISYIQKLEKRIKKLESEKAIIVTGNITNISPQFLDISLTKLIDIYNDTAQILSAYAVTTSLNPKSYKEKNQENTILQKVNRGNYWVILLGNEIENNYYLVPNIDIKFKMNRVESLYKLFKTKGDIKNNTANFTLIKPAKLEILPSGEEWQVIDKGELLFGNESARQKLLSELEILTANNDKSPSNLESLLTILTNFNQGNSLLKTEIKSLDTRLQKLEPIYTKLINLYHENPEQFFELDGGFSRLKFTEITIKNFLQGDINLIELELSNSGEFILKQTDDGDYLFPNPQHLFDKNTISLAHYTKLIVAENEIPIAILGKDINIKKPAKLRKKGTNWLMIESGLMKF